MTSERGDRKVTVIADFTQHALAEQGLYSAKSPSVKKHMRLTSSARHEAKHTDSYLRTKVKRIERELVRRGITPLDPKAKRLAKGMGLRWEMDIPKSWKE